MSFKCHHCAGDFAGDPVHFQTHLGESKIVQEQAVNFPNGAMQLITVITRLVESRAICTLCVETVNAKPKQEDLQRLPGQPVGSELQQVPTGPSEGSHGTVVPFEKPPAGTIPS